MSPADCEDGPVVDFQDARPRVKDFGLGVCDVASAHQSQRPHVLVHTGHAVVEHHGVGDDSAGHAPHLWHVGHAKQAGNAPVDVRAVALHLVQNGGHAVYAFFHRVRPRRPPRFCGNDTSRARSARSDTEPSSQPESGNLASPLRPLVKTQ